MNALIVITIINSTFATFFFMFCLKIIDKKNENRKKIHIFLTVIFFISYFILFYIIQASSQSEIKNWYMIDSIISVFSGFGLLAMLYSIYKKIKNTLRRK